MKTFQKIILPFKRLSGVLFHPADYFSQDPVRFADGVTAISLLFIATFLQKLMWRVSPGEILSPGTAVKDAALNTLMAWTGFFAIYSIIARIFKKGFTIPDLLASTGSASLPLTLTALVSALCWWIANATGMQSATPAWITSQNILGWVGLALSWPGWMGFYILREKLLLPGKWSYSLTALLLVIFLAGWIVSTLG